MGKHKSSRGLIIHSPYYSPSPYEVFVEEGQPFVCSGKNRLDFVYRIENRKAHY